LATETKIKAALSGAAGSMGRRVGAALAGLDGVDFVAGLVKPEQIAEKDIAARLFDDVSETIESCDVLLDFTARERTMELAAFCAAKGRAYFVGTTGLTADDLKALENFAATVPILYAPNLTRGAATLFGITELLAGRLGTGYDAKILGLHHNRKKETPSGTSAEFARRIQDGRREETPPEIATLLAGSTYGTHEILFAGTNDEIRISHTVTRPEIDTDVLDTALNWLVEKDNGFFGLPEILA